MDVIKNLRVNDIIYKINCVMSMIIYEKREKNIYHAVNMLLKKIAGKFKSQ